nr:hypothetical protein [Bacillus licheniformis]
MDSRETFIGSFEGEELAGIASFIHTAEKLTICRLAVHPVHFRKGIAMAAASLYIDGEGSRIV